MKDFKILKILDAFRNLFELLGVDYDIMRRILQVKLTMDGRCVPTIIRRSSNKKTENKDENSFIKSLWLYGLMGLIMLPFVMINNYIFGMSLIFGMIMFMIMTSLISDFSSVLLDIRDKNIIFSKPVSSKTLSMAKTIHILIYMFFLTFALSGMALVLSLIKHGLVFFIIFLLEIILMDLLIVVLTALLYLIILKFFDGEKLKDIINYVQIGLSIAITIGYQLIGRLFSFVNLNAVFSPKWWQYFIVPIWFGAPFELALHSNTHIYYVIFSLLAVFVPIISIIIYIKLIPSFEKNLQKLNNNGTKTRKKNKKIFERISRLVCFDKKERIFFRFASDMMKNERDFKLKVYPSLGFALIFPFIFIFSELHANTLHNIASGKMYLNIYFCALLLPTVVMMMKYSVQYKGSWIYKVMPIENVAPVFKGTLKALIVKLLCPIFIAESILFIIIFGFRILPDLIAVLLNVLLFTLICFHIIKKSLPFSEPFESGQQSERFTIFPLMILLGILAGIHYGITLIHYGIYIYIVILILGNIAVWKYSLNISWESLQQNND